jgi:surfeit locus 1 family protein
MVAITASLGLWQLDRAAQKTALQDSLRARGAMPAWSNADLLGAADVNQGLHRPVRLQGRWLAQHTVFLDNRQMNAQQGFYVVTPLRLSGSDRVLLVQRGWVPRDFQDRSRVPDVPTPEGEQVVEGRLVPPPGRLLQFDEAGNGPIRQNVDPLAFGAETGLPLLNLSVQQTGDTGESLLRRDWPQPATDVSKHHGYAFQWFALCALLAGLYLWFQILQPLRARARSHGPDTR